MTRALCLALLFGLLVLPGACGLQDMCMNIGSGCASGSHEIAPVSPTEEGRKGDAP